ncbi:hypothetical protein H632_c4577p0, partial [Helicosporidium sp. ATCC 50920]
RRRGVGGGGAGLASQRASEARRGGGGELGRVDGAGALPVAVLGRHPVLFDGGAAGAADGGLLPRLGTFVGRRALAGADAPALWLAVLALARHARAALAPGAPPRARALRAGSAVQDGRHQGARQGPRQGQRLQGSRHKRRIPARAAPRRRPARRARGNLPGPQGAARRARAPRRTGNLRGAGLCQGIAPRRLAGRPGLGGRLLVHRALLPASPGGRPARLLGDR